MFLENIYCWGLITLIFIICSLIVVWIFEYFRFHTKRYERNMNLKKPVGLPFLGVIPDLLNIKPDEILLRVLTMVGVASGRYPVGAIEIGPKLLVGLITAEAAEIILSSKEFITKSYEYKLIEPWLGTGLLTSGGSKWVSRRKMLTPAFHFKILKDFMDVFNEQANILVKNLEKELDCPRFNIVSYVSLCTLDVICETAMGKVIGAQANRNSDYVKAVYRISELIQLRQARPWLYPDWIYALTNWGSEHRSCLKNLHGFTKKVVQEQKKEHKRKEIIVKNPVDDDKDTNVYLSEKKKRRLAFLNLLIEASENDSSFTENNICEEVDTFMFEGHDTTALAISWCLYLLGTRPDHQEKVFEELDEIFGDSDRPVTSADLTEMKYLEMCLKESLRLYPSVPAFARSVTKDTKICDSVIPAGSTAVVIPVVIHRDPRIYPNPEVFNPENFSFERIQNRHPYAYIPFSAGPRNCIGQRFAVMEEKVILSTILRKYRMKAVDHRDEVILMGDLILRPKGGLHISISKRA